MQVTYFSLCFSSFYYYETTFILLLQGGFVDPMHSGKKVLGVFGFCDIRNFNIANETLKEDVMVFVNKIAGILHKRVD